MRQTICVKPCMIAGKRYAKGQSIPDGAIVPGRYRQLENMGIIATVEITAPPAPIQAEPAKPPTRRKKAEGK